MGWVDGGSQGGTKRTVRWERWEGGGLVVQHEFFPRPNTTQPTPTDGQECAMAWARAPEGGDAIGAGHNNANHLHHWQLVTAVQ